MRISDGSADVCSSDLGVAIHHLDPGGGELVAERVGCSEVLGGAGFLAADKGRFDVVLGDCCSPGLDAQVQPGRLQPLPLELHDPRLDDHTPDAEGSIAVTGGEHPADAGPATDPVAVERSAERSVGKAGVRKGRTRWYQDHIKK